MRGEAVVGALQKFESLLAAPRALGQLAQGTQLDQRRRMVLTQAAYPTAEQTPCDRKCLTELSTAGTEVS